MIVVSLTSVFDFKKRLRNFLILFGNDFDSINTNFLVVKLCNDPKQIAITVHVKHTTLYGILKSGAGRFTNKVSV